MPWIFISLLCLTIWLEFDGLLLDTNVVVVSPVLSFSFYIKILGVHVTTILVQHGHGISISQPRRPATGFSAGVVRNGGAVTGPSWVLGRWGTCGSGRPAAVRSHVNVVGGPQLLQ